MVTEGKVYINYAKLWRLLAEKEITKSDLMELTGLSSRVIAKLTKNETVYWKQLYMLDGMSSLSIVKNVLVKPVRSADEVVIVVIKGKPGSIIGLDDGIWVFARKGKLSGPKDVFVMSEAVFKLFSPEL